MRPPIEHRRVMDPAEKAARLEADQLGDIQAGRAPRQLRDDPAPTPTPSNLGLLLLRALQRAALPVTAAELAAYLGAPLPHVTAVLNALARGGRVLVLRGDGRGPRYWLRGRYTRHGRMR
jgi:hypothetical protein